MSNEWTKLYSKCEAEEKLVRELCPNVEGRYVVLAVSEIDRSESAAVNTRNDKRNGKQTIARYTADKKKGDVFPCGVYHRETGRLIRVLGGNRRLEADVALGRTHVYGLLLTGLSPAEQTTICYKLNDLNGQPNPEDERVSRVVDLAITTGRSITKLAKEFDIKEGVLSRLVKIEKLRLFCHERSVDLPPLRHMSQAETTLENVSRLPGEVKLAICRLLVASPSMPSEDIDRLYIAVKGKDVPEAKRLAIVEEAKAKELERVIRNPSPRRTLGPEEKLLRYMSQFKNALADFGTLSSFNEFQRKELLDSWRTVTAKMTDLSLALHL